GKWRPAGSEPKAKPTASAKPRMEEEEGPPKLRRPEAAKPEPAAKPEEPAPSTTTTQDDKKPSAPAPGNPPVATPGADSAPATAQPDRKSTRLNSSHLGISYAVFCLKKKMNT